MNPEVWLSGFAVGIVLGQPLALLLYRLTPPIVNAVLARAHRGRA